MTWKRKIAWAIGAIVLALALAAAWMLGPALLPPERVDVGIAVGETAPVDMQLADSTGSSMTLASSMGEKGMVVFFVRSADWCPFCKPQLIRTKEIAARIEAMGYSVAGLSYDQPPQLAVFKAEEEIGFILISDQGSALIDALGLREPQYEAGSFAHGVPRASILVLARDGTVLEKYVAADYRSRPSNDDVLEMVRDADAKNRIAPPAPAQAP